MLATQLIASISTIDCQSIAAVTHRFSTKDVAPTVSSAFVCRVSGLPVSAIGELAEDKLTHLAACLLAVEEELLCEREVLSAQLYNAIGRVRDKDIRSRLLALRRSLYNNRRPSVSEIDAAGIALSADLLAEVRAAHAALIGRDELLWRLHLLHDQAVVQAQYRLRAVLTDADFQNGLVLSSRTLWATLPQYLDGRYVARRGRTEHVERGLLRYFTRMATKATPFGTFCAVIGGEFTKPTTDAPILAFEGNPRLKRSVVRLNKRIYALLWAHLCNCSAVRARLAIELNPTLRSNDDQLLFLTGRFGQEIFQCVPRTDALGLVLELASARGGRSFADLVAALACDPRCDADPDEARDYLDKLIGFGLLRFRAVVAEQEANWTKPLAAFLDGIEDLHAQTTAQLVRDLDELKEQYSFAVASARADILDALARRLREGFDKLGQEPWTISEPLLYEDATADARLRIAETPEMRKSLDRLGEWAALTLPLNGSRLDMAPMRHFFDRQYARDRANTSIPLLTFYEDYYRLHFREHIERTSDHRGHEAGGADPSYDARNPFGQECIRKLRAAWAELAEAIRVAWAADTAAIEVTVTREMLESALDTADAAPLVTGRSTAVFAQVLPGSNGDVRILVQRGRLFGGFGKYFSRFLYLLPECWREAVFRDNESLTKDLLAEICGDAAFNGNLHPQLLPWEISYPTGPSGGSAHQIPCGELEVVAHPEDADALILRHRPSGRRVVPVDLGFLNPFMRPPLYQLLSRFSQAGAFEFPLPSSAKVGQPREHSEPEPRIVYRPRITYEGAVVLARRRWHIPHGCYPEQARIESDAEYYVRLARWRRDQGVPNRVYARVAPVSRRLGVAQEPQGDEEERSEIRPDEPHAEGSDDTANPHLDRDVGSRQHRFSRDFQKPQFIDFSVPLLVRLFARLGGGLDRFDLVLEECLPDAEQLPVGPSGPHAVELIFQISFPGRAANKQ